MKVQSKSTLSYILRNIWRLLPIAAVPAVLMGFFFHAGSSVNVIADVLYGKVTHDGFLDALMRETTVLRFSPQWWALPVSILALVLCESALVSFVGRHMRMGVASINRSIRESLSYWVRMALFVVVFFAAVEVCNLIVAGISLILNFIENVYVQLAIACVLTVTLRLLQAVVFALFLCSFPATYCERYPLNVALSYSVRLTSPRPKFFWGFAALYMLLRLAMLTLGYFANGTGFDVAVYCVYYLWWVIYAPCLAFKAYFDFIGGERRDLQKKMF